MSCPEEILEDDYNINPVARYGKLFPAIISIILASIYFGTSEDPTFEKECLFKILENPFAFLPERFYSTKPLDWNKFLPD
ncbi:hypothetical protein CEXT_624531 [Caerostris extrusa]|uniref:Uncharacterized protein n=1 Tax=Caerostris extrusa TaxID=172846 RepID=A0AAV4MTG5_CAEEX|nr:hypothetical protein CEXT_624531 [Caerostris extrusa]